MRVETATWGPERGWHTPLPRPDGRSSLVLVFGRLPGPAEVASGVPDPLAEGHDPLIEISRLWGDHAIIGCATPGQLAGANQDDDADDVALSVTVARFDRTEVLHAQVEVQRAGGARSAGRAIADELQHPSLRAVWAVGDGVALNGVAFAAGFADRLAHVPLAGGLSGDGQAPGSAWTLVAGARRSGWVSAVGFAGDHLEVGFGAGGGWDVLGPERLVTQSYGNVLYELDGRPALPLYREYLGDLADDLPQAAVRFPLLVRDLDERSVIRTVWAVNPATDSLRLGGDVPQGAVAQLMRAVPDRLVEGSYRAAKRAAIGGEELALTVSCSGRRQVLGPRIDEELDAAREVLDPSVHVAGFYGIGSLSPDGGATDMHNEAIAFTTLREVAAVSS